MIAKRDETASIPGLPLYGCSSREYLLEDKGAKEGHGRIITDSPAEFLDPMFSVGE